LLERHHGSRTDRQSPGFIHPATIRPNFPACLRPPTRPAPLASPVVG
jgi:hypothetical protein